MKVLHVIPYHPSPSSYIFAKRQVNDLIKQGVHCETFYLKARLNPFSLLKQWFNYRKVVREFSPDLIHAHYGTITAYFTTRMIQKPFVVSLHGSDVNKTKDISVLRERLGKYMTYQAVKKATKLICVSEKLKQKLKHSQEKVYVLANGIDTSVFKRIDREEAKRELQLELATNYIFFNASNPIIKRLDIAEKVIELLKEVQVKLLMLEGSVLPDDIPLYLNAASVLLLCSDSEGSPMVVKEAMACGLPIVSVDVGDVKERIAEVENCYIVPQDPQKIAWQIREMLRNGNPYTNGLETLIGQGLDSASVTNRLIQIYGEALHG